MNCLVAITPIVSRCAVTGASSRDGTLAGLGRVLGVVTRLHPTVKVNTYV